MLLNEHDEAMLELFWCQVRVVFERVQRQSTEACKHREHRLRVRVSDLMVRYLSASVQARSGSACAEVELREGLVGSIELTDDRPPYRSSTSRVQSSERFYHDY